MKKSVLLALAALLISGSAGASPDALDQRVSLDIRDATVDEAFRSVARAAGVQITLDGVSGKDVTLQLENARVRTVLAALCDNLGCRWDFADGNPPVLRVTPDPAAARSAKSPKSNAAALDAAIDLKVTNANVRDLLGTTAEIMGAKAAIDPGIKGKVTLNLENAPLRSAIDAACEAAGCEWRYDAEKNVLTFKPKA